MRSLPVIALLVLLSTLAACDEPMGPNVDMGDVTVSAAQRLKDYRELSRYPDHSRPAAPDTPALDRWPGIAGKPAATGARPVAWDGEELRDGSLVVFAKVEVREAGRYSFVTVLEDAGTGRKLAVSRPTIDLAAGTARIAFSFYGLILHEAGTGGPFLLRGIVGERLLTDDDIDRMTSGAAPSSSPEGALPPLEAEYRTATYAPAKFTTKEYDSPFKRQRIRELEAEARREAAAEQQ